MKIKVTDTVKIFHDGWSWRVEQFVEEHINEVGKYRGNIIPADWVTVPKYFTRPDDALRYVMNQQMASSTEEVSIKEFEQFCIKFKEDFKKECKEVVGKVEVKSLL